MLDDDDDALEALDRKLGPTLTLGQRELVRVRLATISTGLDGRRAARIAAVRAALRALDERDFGTLRAELEAGRLTVADWRARMATTPSYEIDAWTRTLFGFQDVPDTTVALSADMVSYVATHVQQIAEMAAELGPSDVFYDLGSGLGFVPILVSWISGARAVGIELEPRFVAFARERAAALGLADRVRFVEGDLREATRDDATAVFLFYPVRGALLAQVIERVRLGVEGRAVRVYSLGLSGPPLVAQPWIAVRGQSPSGLLGLISRADAPDDTAASPSRSRARPAKPPAKPRRR
jgi:hypothetical protein